MASECRLGSLPGSLAMTFAVSKERRRLCIVPVRKVLALFVGVHSALAQVTNLGIAPAGGQSVLYWPANSTANYVLQTVTNLSSTNWLTARTSFAVNAAEVTNAAPSGFG
jgi:hypothetical protein